MVHTWTECINLNYLPSTRYMHDEEFLGSLQWYCLAAAPLEKMVEEVWSLETPNAEVVEW